MSISAISSLSQHPISSHVPSSFTHAPSASHLEAVEYGIQPRNFLYLIPTITGIVLGILFLPHFGLGLAFGAAHLAIKVISIAILKKAGILQESPEENNEYGKYIRKSLLAVSLFGPIAEEGIFRGLIQPLGTKSIQILVPAAAAALFGTGLNVATAVSIVATSVLFGAAHYFNPHKNAHIQAVSATLGGLTWGLLSAQFGIGAAIAGHISNNSILGFFVAFKTWDKERDSVLEQRKFDVAPLPT